jgi:hypothetical protein
LPQGQSSLSFNEHQELMLDEQNTDRSGSVARVRGVSSASGMHSAAMNGD